MFIDVYNDGNPSEHCSYDRYVHLIGSDRWSNQSARPFRDGPMVVHTIKELGFRDVHITQHMAFECILMHLNSFDSYLLNLVHS